MSNMLSVSEHLVLERETRHLLAMTHISSSPHSASPLENGLHDLPPGKLAAIVTYLEMFERPAPRGMSAPDGVTLQRVETPSPDWYRALYRKVGEDWLWFSRLSLSNTELAATVQHKDVEVYSVQKDGVDLGLLELDFRDPDNTELAFFGLHSDLIGSGTGRWMMEQALNLAFARPIKRFFVHTCTLDSPQALPFYMRSGFTPYGRAIEVMDDPRQKALPQSAAPHIPLI